MASAKPGGRPFPSEVYERMLKECGVTDRGRNLAELVLDSAKAIFERAEEWREASSESDLWSISDLAKRVYIFHAGELAATKRKAAMAANTLAPKALVEIFHNGAWVPREVLEICLDTMTFTVKELAVHRRRYRPDTLMMSDEGKTWRRVFSEGGLSHVP